MPTQINTDKVELQYWFKLLPTQINTDKIELQDIAKPNQYHNSYIQTLKHRRYKARYLFQGRFFGAIMGSAKIAKKLMPLKDTTYTVLNYSRDIFGHISVFV